MSDFCGGSREEMLPEGFIMIFMFGHHECSGYKQFIVLDQTRTQIQIPASDRSRFDEVVVFQRAARKWHFLLEFMLRKRDLPDILKGFARWCFLACSSLILIREIQCNPSLFVCLRCSIVSSV